MFLFLMIKFYSLFPFCVLEEITTTDMIQSTAMPTLTLPTTLHTSSQKIGL
jgi:hypothetical protein